MSELRETMRASRRAHRAKRYPGDLAGELLGRRRIPPTTLALGTIGAGALAAAAAVLLLLSRPASTPATVSPAPAIPLARNLQLSPPKLQFELPSLPTLRGLPSLPEHFTTLRPLDQIVPASLRNFLWEHMRTEPDAPSSRLDVGENAQAVSV